MRRRASASVVAFVSCLVLLVPAALGQTLIDLGTLSGGSSGSSYGLGINELGDVVGESASSDEPRGFVWTSSTMHDLQSLGPYPNRDIPSAAYGINDEGEIVGWSMTGLYPDEDYAVIHMQDEWYMENIGDDLGVYRSYTFAVNQAGIACGEAAVMEIAGQEAFYHDGSVHRMGVFTGAGSTIATAINNASPFEIAGWGAITGNQRRAFLWSNGSYTNLGTRLGGSHSAAFGINDEGLVAGVVTDSSNYDHAYIFDGPSGGTDLGKYSSTISACAIDINNNDEAVGYSLTGAYNTNRALYWAANGDMTDLTDYIGTSNGWTIFCEATAINDAGQIVGTGVKNGKFRAYLLNMP